jgi:hypothetical protein
VSSTVEPSPLHSQGHQHHDDTGLHLSTETGYLTSLYPQPRPGLLYGLAALEDASPGASYVFVALGAAAVGFALGFMCRASATL